MAGRARKPLPDLPDSAWQDDLACLGIVLSTSVQIARNVADAAFPETLSPEERRTVRDDILASLREHVADLGEFSAGSWSWLDLEKAGPDIRQACAEKLDASPRVPDPPEGTGVLEFAPRKAPKGAASLHVLVNDGDHLRFRGSRPDGNVAGVYRRVAAMEAAFDGVVADYAFDATYGYLTPDPADMGTGLHLSADFQLLGLRLAGDIDRVFRALDRLGLAIRPVREEVGNEAATLFRVSSVQTLGEDEERILMRTDAIFQDLAIAEDRARMRLSESNAPVLRDFLGRAYGTALHAALLTVPEAMELHFTALAGLDMGLYQTRATLPVPDPDLLTRPATYRLDEGTGLSPEEIDARRADEMRAFYKRLRFRP